MAKRTRSRSSGVISGYRHNNYDNTDTPQLSFTDYEEITDYTDVGNGHDLDVYKVHQVGGILNQTTEASAGISFYNYRCDGIAGPLSGVFGFSTVPGAPTNAAAATSVLKATNPSRPLVDLPVFVAELRDFPRLFRVEGDTLLRRAGSANLNYQFGWRPLISDLFRLCSFQDAVATRQRELEDLFKSGLRRKRQVFSGQVVQDYNSLVQSLGASKRMYYLRTTNERVWGYCTWKASTSTPPQTPDAMRSLARRAVLGLTVDLSTAWELMPWSWLIDWCSNVGDYLQATRNIIGATPSPVQVMRMRTAEQSSYRTAENVSPHSSRTVSKLRRKSTPSLSAYLPWLTLRQLSILGSIGVTRRMPR